MTEWTVVLVISALVGLFFTVGKPILNLNAAVTKLNLSVDNLQAYQKEQDLRMKEHTEQLKDHEHRITVLEMRQDKESE